MPERSIHAKAARSHSGRVPGSTPPGVGVCGGWAWSAVVEVATWPIWRYRDRMTDPLTLTAVFTPDDDGWTMAQLAEWPAVVTCGRTLEEAREMLLDAAREMVASYRDEGREPPLGGGHVEQVTIDIAAA